MKLVMTMASLAVAAMAAPLAHADPDPHSPDLGANYCPGGATPAPEATCDGVPFDDGTYWHAIQHGTGNNYNFVVVQCVKPPPDPGIFGGLVPQVSGPVPAPNGCGRG